MQYLLNATSIWLISLIAFDIFLRRESYHGYNRFYLLSTFILGLTLPLVQMVPDSYLKPALQHPVERVINVKEQVVNTAAATAVDTWQWLWTIYLAGAGIAMCLLIAEVIKLISYYRGANKWKQGNWTIVETGREHAPFSFMSILFVRTAAQYNDTEWQMLFNHEKQHAEQAHVIDLLLMQFSRVLFWFHPLVYIYNNRLLMVHEYQADSVPSMRPSEYGHFLVEQAILGRAPVITHSFNRSPIKKRIVMLTRRSGTAARTKMLAFIPVAVVSLLCFSQSVFSQKMERKGNTVSYRGNKFVLSKEQIDTIEVTDPTTGQSMYKVVKTIPRPTKMNGKTVYSGDGVEPGYTGPNKNIRLYLLKQLKDELVRLDNAEYVLNIDNLVIDEKGNVVYFEDELIQRAKMPNEPNVPIDKTKQNKIHEKTTRVLNTAKVFRPGLKDGAPSPSIFYDGTFGNRFKVENSKIYDRKEDGTWIEI
jgi:bla regulator protein BlaR1